MSNLIPVLCGGEEPVRANPFFLSFDQATNCFSEEDINIPGLNRYSVVFNTDTAIEIIKAAESKIAEYLIRTSSNSYWMCAWDIPEAADVSHRKSPILLRWMQKTTRERLKQGWRLCPKPVDTAIGSTSLQIAILSADDTDTSGFAPIGYCSPYTEYRIILASEFKQNPCDLVQEKLFAELAFMCDTGSFHPSRALLTWIAETNITLAFPRQSSSDRIGIVVLRTVPFSSEDLYNMGVTEVRSGTEAQTVWSR